MVVKVKRERIWERDIVVKTTRDVNAWGSDWPAGTELPITDVRDLTVEVRFPGGYVGTLPKADVIPTERKDSTMNLRLNDRDEDPDNEVDDDETSDDVRVNRPKLSTAQRRKQEAIAVAASAARIMEEAKARRAANGQTEKGTRERKPKKVRPPKVDNGMIPLKKICIDIGIDPRVARRLLRKSKDDAGATTEGRWEWPPERVSTVSALLKRLANDD